MQTPTRAPQGALCPPSKRERFDVAPSRVASPAIGPSALAQARGRLACHITLALACIAAALGHGPAAHAQAAYPPATTTLSVARGQTATVWVQGNYNVLCRSGGQPTFTLDKPPTLGEVHTEWGDYTVPDGQRCETMRFPGLVVTYHAGQQPGTDVLTWTVGFPRELTSKVPSSGPHTVTTTVTVE